MFSPFARPPSRIRRLPSLRKKKIAMRKWLAGQMKAELSMFENQPNSPVIRAKLVDVVMKKSGRDFDAYANIEIQPIYPVSHITFNVSVLPYKPKVEPIP